MRHGVRFLMATALVVPFGFIAGAPGAGAAAGTNCAHSSGTATFTPSLPKLGAGTTVKPKIKVSAAKAAGCKGGGVKSAKLSGTQKFHDPTSCDILLGGGPPGPHPPTGTLTAKWNTGATSTMKVTLNSVSGQPTQTHITGTVSAGLFVGLHVDQVISFTPKSGDCVTTNLASVTFAEVSHLVIS
jgi:hypothetical protein